MFHIKTYNAIASQGLEKFPNDQYTVSATQENPHAIILRSHKLEYKDIPKSVLAVGRAGAGVNNIPVAQLTEMGIPVFNTPGANANAVKELVIASLFLASRNICQAWQYTQNLTGSDEALNQQVEAGKKQYKGFELPKRSLGVIGLGAIGVKVANAAIALGMQVIGYDPTISIKRAWELSSDVKEASSVEELLKEAQFISLHIPLLDDTHHFINAARLSIMQSGATLLNFSRAPIVDEEALLVALASKKLHAYICDFPSNRLYGQPGYICLPHLGASTNEAEINCAIMIADQIRAFLEKGQIHNSVNFPEIKLSFAQGNRLLIANANIPNMVAQISTHLASANLNIIDFLNKSRGNIAFSIIDVDNTISNSVINQLKTIEGVLNVRALGGV